MTHSLNNRHNTHDHDLRHAVWRLYEFIADTLYFSRQDMDLNGRPLNATLLMSLATAINGGKALIIGEPGLGKTTSAEYVCALVYGLPLGVVWRASVSGHPEQTEEKIVGRPDLGRLNSGEEVVRWSYFTLLPTKIVDELNRLPETKQSMILDGVDRGKWAYLNDAVVNSEYCLFATANDADQGTNTIVAPLMDRFDVMVESKHPGANLAYRVGAEGTNGLALRDEELEAKIHRLLAEPTTGGEQCPDLERFCTQYGDKLAEQFGIRPLTRVQRQSIRRQVRRLDLDMDANAFLRLLLVELSFCHPFGQKRTHERCKEGCHFTEYLCHAVKSCISNRFAISVQHYAKTLAWLAGETRVGIQHVVACAPYALAHRVTWHEKTVAQWDMDTRSDALVIHMAKKAVGQVHRRYMEQSLRVKDALAAAYRIAEGEAVSPVQGDHPIFWDIMRDLGRNEPGME